LDVTAVGPNSITVRNVGAVGNAAPGATAALGAMVSPSGSPGISQAVFEQTADPDVTPGPAQPVGSIWIDTDALPVMTPAGTGIPVGGALGQVLTKDTALDYDVSWQTVGIVLPAPTAAATVQTFIDPYGDVWVARASYDGGNWHRATDVVNFHATRA